MANTAVVIAYDDSDGWYDHVVPQIVNASATPSDHSLFVGAHIQSAIFAGPDSKPEGIEQLKAVVRNIPRGHAIVVYCGCCPFEKCPNVRPAYKALKELGFEQVKVLEIPTNLHTDWESKGYPTTKGAGY